MTTNGPPRRSVFLSAGARLTVAARGGQSAASAPRRFAIQISWTLLAWCAVVATLISAGFERALALRAPGDDPTAPASPQSPSPWTPLRLLAALFLWPLAYGAAFELAGTADALLGFLAGCVHAAVGGVFWWQRRRAVPDLRPAPADSGAAAVELSLVTARFHAFVFVLARVLYGTLLGYLYVVPSG